MASTRHIGIDLGTSTTCAAVVENGVPVVIPAPGNSKVSPSYIHLRDDGRILIGEGAKSEAVADPYNTVWATKRLIGRGFDEPEVAECVKKLTYRITGAQNGAVLINSRDKAFPPDWVASLLLKYVVRQAEIYLREPVKKAVVTVPGTFTKAQREATRLAARKAAMCK